MPNRYKATVAVVLDTMWGWCGREPEQAPRWYRINPENHSGKRLYKLTGLGMRELLVTNICREVVSNPNQYGKPDKVWLRENLGLMDCSVLLVCGTRARDTFEQLNRVPVEVGRILKISHPAARNWTTAKLDEVSKLIKDAIDAGQ